MEPSAEPSLWNFSPVLALLRLIDLNRLSDYFNYLYYEFLSEIGVATGFPGPY